MNRASDYCSWMTVVGCWLVAHCPQAQVALVYISMVVGIFNATWLIKRIFWNINDRRRHNDRRASRRIGDKKK